MTEGMVLRLLYALLYSFCIPAALFPRENRHAAKTGTKVHPHVQGYVLPGMVLSILAAVLILRGFSWLPKILRYFFPMFLHISLFYVLLLIFLPLLRKCISARACAILWLVPSCLVLVGSIGSFLSSPLLVIPIPGNFFEIFLYIWFAGFAVLFAWKLVGHILFRRRILKNAVPVTDRETMAIWNQILYSVGMENPKFSLVRSPAVSAPLTVGLFRRKTRVVLPEKDYSQEELRLVLRHEIIHIARGDTWNKFFMAFCTAMCWFNPLMWIAMRKSADDFELSCDETVLENANRATRLQYADLLLNTAGDERGFTTCLSATAKAMRHRLRCVTHPPARYSGAIVVGVLLFILCMTCGCIALGYEPDTGENIIYQWGAPEECTFESVSVVEEKPQEGLELVEEMDCKVLDAAAFEKYLSGLTLYKLTGDYSYTNLGTHYSCSIRTPQGVLYLRLYDQGVYILSMLEQNYGDWYYYLPDGLDWDYLESIILELPPMTVGGQNMTLRRLWKVEEDGRNLLYTNLEKTMELSYSYRHDFASLCTPFQLAEPCTILVEHWNYTREYTVTMEDLAPEFQLKLAFYPAHYTVFAKFYGEDGTLYEAEYAFDIAPSVSNT